MNGLDATKVGTAKIGENVVLMLKEPLTADNCEAFEKIFDQVIDQNPSSLILDLKPVAFMDSVALELLIKVHDTVARQGGVVKLANLNDVCRDILVVTRLINLFRVYEDVAEAARSRQ